MKCSTRPRCSLNNEDHQPFPSKRDWSHRLNRTRKDLDRLQKSHVEPVYSYVISSVGREKDGDAFIQEGCGPNFQGGLLTLCTCKHRMRTYPKITNPNSGVWIAGFTGVNVHGKKNWLFYLMRIREKEVFESHYDLWNFDSRDWKRIRKEKSSREHRLGDLFQPKRNIRKRDSKLRFQPESYYPPCWCHVHANHEKKRKPPWHKDICYERKKGRRKAVLLLGEKKSSFLWSGPKICFADGRHPRGEKHWPKLQDFLGRLREKGATHL